VCKQSPFHQVFEDHAAKLGGGSFGEVYLSKNQNGDLRAVKVIDGTKSRGNQRQIMAEVDSWHELEEDAPNIVKYYDHWGWPIRGEGRLLCISMQYCSGGTLKDQIQKGAMDPAMFRPILRDIAAAVSHMHEKDIVHRDLYPANILLDASGSANVCDFGFARSTQEKGRTTSEMKTLRENERGYRPYWSPEHCKKGENWKYGKPDDMWSIGMIVLEALTGKFIQDKIGWDGFGHTTHSKKRKELIEEAQGKDPELFQLGKNLIAKKLYYTNVKTRLKAKQLLSNLQEMECRVIHADFAKHCPGMLKEVNNTELVDLRSSIKDIKISGLKRLAEAALTFAQEKLHGKTKDSMGLNQNEIAAINLYTREGLHKLMNMDLRGGNLTRARPY
jgi:serine/threonine protein kinase